MFLAVAFGGSVLLSLVIGLSGGSSGSMAKWAPLITFVPALGVLSVRVIGGRPLNIEWRRFPLRWLPVALFVLPVAIHVMALPVVVLLSGRLP